VARGSAAKLESLRSAEESPLNLIPADKKQGRVTIEDLMEDEGITGMSGGSDEMEDTFRFRKFVEPAGNR